MNLLNYKTLSLFISSMLITGTVLADKSIDQDICLTANTAPLPGAYQANYHLHLTKINSKATPKLFAINALDKRHYPSFSKSKIYFVNPFQKKSVIPLNLIVFYVMS